VVNVNRLGLWQRAAILTGVSPAWATSLFLVMKYRQPRHARELEEWFFKPGSADISAAANKAIADQFQHVSTANTKGQSSQTEVRVVAGAKLEWRVLLKLHGLDGDVRLSCCSSGTFAWSALGHHLRTTSHQQKATEYHRAHPANQKLVSSGLAVASAYADK
jgi:hypothetical protein